MHWRNVWTFVLLASLVAPPVHAGEHGTWKGIGDVGAIGLLVTSLTVPTVRRDWTGLRQAVYTAALSEGFALADKSLIREERPDHSNHRSFPSGHSALAFGAATTLYRRYGWQYGFPAYAVATLTGYARVAAREHHWWDVVASAAFSTGAGWLVTHPLNDRVQMTPWIGDRGGGLVVAIRW